MVLLSFVLLLGGSLTASVSDAASPRLGVSPQVRYDPTAPFPLQDELTVHLVFVGIEPSDVREDMIRSVLPAEYAPVVRIPHFYYGLTEYIGIRFTFAYDFIYLDEPSESDIFSAILANGVMGAATVYQAAYSADRRASVSITENLRVPAEVVEAHLESTLASRIGTDYTIVFLDGYRGGDLPFHTYWINEPDPDTLEPFGLRDSRQMIAFGGTHGRLWYYDFSAGPDFWTTNFDPSLYWNPRNYAIPPIWHYVPMRRFDPVDQLSTDVAYLTRFVGINLLFSPSPLYRPILADEMHANFYGFQRRTLEGILDMRDFFTVDYSINLWRDLEPHKSWVATDEVAFLEDDPFAYDLILSQKRGTWPYDEAYYYFTANRDMYLDADTAAEADYSAMFFNFVVEDADMGKLFGLLGFADDDYQTGTQSFTYSFVYPDVWDFGFGFTSTIIHEGGHHFGLSHPHDGYDYELNVDYDALGFFQFVWAGDEVYSTMSYMGNVMHFSAFDRDYLYRSEASLYLRASFDALGGHAPSGRVARIINDAVEAFDEMDYATMVAKAQQAWVLTTGGEPNNAGGTSSVVVSLDEKSIEYRLAQTPAASPSITLSSGVSVQARGRDD